MATTFSATDTTSTRRGGRHLSVALLVIATAQLMVVLDATVVNVALPHIQEALSNAATSPDGTSHWGDATVVAALTAGVVLLAAFAFIEARSRHALLPVRLLRSRNRGVPLVLTAPRARRRLPVSNRIAIRPGNPIPEHRSARPAPAAGRNSR
jgi:hypothetical protein